MSDSYRDLTAEQARKQAEAFVRMYNQQRGRVPTAFTHSYGCQQNVADGETLEGLLLTMGYSLVDQPDRADLVIYNTCAVRENAEDRVFGNIGALKKAKQENPQMLIALCGCMVQQQHLIKKVKENYPFVDLIFGAGAMDTLPQLLMDQMLSGERVVAVGNPTTAIIEDLPVHREGGMKASVPIMTGCDNFCSYCVVPLVRGRERSREPEAIVGEVAQLVAQGYKEITLLGQNVNSYGKGLGETIRFSELLGRLAGLPGEFRLRFMTSHPKDCTEELIDVMAAHEKICKHIHLPVQSGSNRILKLMNRGYTVEHYLELVDYARKVIPEITFSSDLIVGFPGETAEDFKETLALVERVGYSALFTFAYSPREGTKAAELENTLTKEEKDLRFRQLLELQRIKANAYHETLVGKTLEVLVDGTAKKSGILTGRTDGNVIVLFPGTEDLIGRLRQIKIESFYNWAIEGQIVPLT